MNSSQKTLKRVLILSYFFPPANFVGGDRIYSWAKHLNKFGYFPVVITRTWNKGQKEITDQVENNVFSHEMYDTYEVYRIPHDRSLRDKLNDYRNSKVLSVIRKALSYIELVASNFSLRFTPYYSIYKFALQHIRDNNCSYTCMIASGRPFQLFYVADKIFKQTGLVWIADYRDEWNTFQNKQHRNFLLKLVGILESNSERKWTSSCSAFITVSDYWKYSIQRLINKTGYVVMNGYEPDTMAIPQGDLQKNINTFNIYYIGTLYPMQEVNAFLEAFRNVCRKYCDNMDIKMHFVGITVIPEVAQNIKFLSAGLEEHVKIYDRLPKSEIQRLYAQADLLLALPYTGIKGWYPVKIFEYFGQNRPVLLCPGDDDVMEDFVIRTNCGFVAKNKLQCEELLEKLITLKRSGKCVELTRNVGEAVFYTRENQAKILSSVIDKIYTTNNK